MSEEKRQQIGDFTSYIYNTLCTVLSHIIINNNRNNNTVILFWEAYNNNNINKSTISNTLFFFNRNLDYVQLQKF